MTVIAKLPLPSSSIESAAAAPLAFCPQAHWITRSSCQQQFALRLHTATANDLLTSTHATVCSNILMSGANYHSSCVTKTSLTVMRAVHVRQADAIADERCDDIV